MSNHFFSENFKINRTSFNRPWGKTIGRNFKSKQKPFAGTFMHFFGIYAEPRINPKTRGNFEGSVTVIFLIVGYGWNRFDKPVLTR